MTNGCDHDGCINPARYYHQVNYQGKYYYTCPEHACCNCVEIT